MTPANEDGTSETTESAGIDRRKVLQLAGGGAIGFAAVGNGAAAMAQTQSGPSHEFVFYGCGGVCTNTSGNHVIVHRDGEYTCEPIDQPSNRTDTTWTHNHTFCYSAEEQSGDQAPGQVVAALSENEYRGNQLVGEGCRVCFNPNDCVTESLPKDPCTILEQLGQCGPCLDGEGGDIVHCGECQNATSASAITPVGTPQGGGSGNETTQ